MSGRSGWCKRRQDSSFFFGCFVGGAMGSREESPIQSQSNLDVRVIRAAHSGVPKPPSEITGYTKVHALNSVGSFPDIPLRKCLHCRMAPREVPFLAVSAAKLGSRRMTIMDRRISAPERYDRGRSLPEAKIYEQALADFQCATGDSEYCGRAYRELGLCLRAMGRKEEAVAALRYPIKLPAGERIPLCASTRPDVGGIGTP